jgi:hypothetical protein
MILRVTPAFNNPAFDLDEEKTWKIPFWLPGLRAVSAR